MKKLKAYTLAEFAVAIGIMGVIAGLLVPALKEQLPNDNQMYIKRVYSQIQKVTQLLAYDAYLFPDNLGFGNTDAASHSSTTGLWGGGFSGEHKFSDLFFSKMNVKEYIKDGRLETLNAELVKTPSALKMDDTTVTDTTLTHSCAVTNENVVICIPVPDMAAGATINPFFVNPTNNTERRKIIVKVFLDESKATAKSAFYFAISDTGKVSIPHPIKVFNGLDATYNCNDGGKTNRNVNQCLLEDYLLESV